MRTALHSLAYALCIFAVIALVVSAMPHVSYAADGFVPLAKVTDSSKLGQLYEGSSGDLSNFINSLFKFALALGAIAAVLRLAYAGYLYMGQADMWSHKGEAKKIIGDVTLGILLLLGIYLILYEINPDIIKLDALRKVRASPAKNVSNSDSIVPNAPAANTDNNAQTIFNAGAGDSSIQ